MNSLENAFSSVKSIDWSKATVSFYVAKRRLVNREAKYSLLQVNVDDNLKKKLRKIATNKVNSSNQALEYDFNTADLDDNVLSIKTSETDLEQLIEEIASETPPSMADSYSSLLGSWLYIARLEVDDDILYSVRRVSEGWSAKKVSQLVSMIFHNNMLVDLDQKEIFRVDGKVDFFSHNGVIFIADKKNFEAALNFREGMVKNRNEIVEDFKETEIFVDAEEIGRLVGDNMKRLRKLSQVKKSGYYLDQNFLNKMRVVNEEEGWGVSYSSDGKVIVTEEDIDVVLRILNNDRLASKINEEAFDVDVKHKL